jgi:hypothetical protein
VVPLFHEPCVNLLIAAFTGEMKDNLAARGLVSESPIFDYPNFEYLEAEGKELPDLNL